MKDERDGDYKDDHTRPNGGYTHTHTDSMIGDD